MMGKYFGTDGIRGVYGDACMNNSFAFRVGFALSRYLCEIYSEGKIRVAIGQDTRASGAALVDALTHGLQKNGVTVYKLGVVPTPAVALSVVEHKFNLGIAVTASHNPAADNGIKLFSELGFKLSKSQETEIETLIDAEQVVLDEQQLLTDSFSLDGAKEYISYMGSLFNKDCLEGLKIVLDLANGATYETTPAVFKKYGAETILIGDRPNGTNINDKVGSEYPLKLGEAVRSHHADIGIAHDGDGDRLVVCDENGTIVDGDILLAMLGVNALQNNTLKSTTLVATVQSNLALDEAITLAGGSVVRTEVGDRNVVTSMRKIGANIGGESSGHIIFLDSATTGDGLLAALHLIDLLRDADGKLSKLQAKYRLFPQETRSLRVAQKLPLGDLRQIQQAISTVETELGTDGRVLIRYSGTESKIRLLVEGKDSEVISSAINKLEKSVRQDLNVVM